MFIPFSILLEGLRYIHPNSSLSFPRRFMDNYRHSLKSEAILISVVCSVSFFVIYIYIYIYICPYLLRFSGVLGYNM